ncbi:unnamed protein product, partial [Laminaria digitata]
DYWRCCLHGNDSCGRCRGRIALYRHTVAMEWLDIASRLAKRADTRNRVFDDPCFLPRLVDAVKAATGNNNNDNSNSGGSGGSTHQHFRDLDINGGDDADDPVFDAPLRASPEATRGLFQAFTFLRDSCAGCPTNNEALRETGLADAALKFAVDQAPFACGPSCVAPPVADADTDTDTTTSSSSSSNNSVSSSNNSSSGGGGGGTLGANEGQTTTTPAVITVAAA